MDSPSKSTGKAAKKEMRPRTPQERKRLKASEEFSFVSEEHSQNSALKGEDIQALTIRQEDLEKLRVQQPPSEAQKPHTVTRVLVRKTRPVEEERRTVKVVVARPVPPDAVVQPLEYTGPGGPRFDAQGMVLPHSILGSLEDFKREMEARGETELVNRVPDHQGVRPPVAVEQRGEEKPRPLTRGRRGPPDLQSHALRHWDNHMAERRRQQDFISQLLQKPIDSLLMNQSNRFRETQEQRELISRGLPALHSGQGYRVGSEFWSVPQRIGDELSGVAVTLTHKERGSLEPVTRIGHPQSVRQETGNVLPEKSARRAWDSSLYLQQCRQELREVLTDLDFNQPEIDGLEVVGTGQPFTSVMAERCPLLEEEETDSETEQKENRDPLAHYDDVIPRVLLVPAVRFCGQPARWIGSSSSHKGEVGIAARLTFEALAGEQASSYLELQNEGSTAVYYSWQCLPLPHSFPETRPDPHTQHFYFNTSTGVILPGDTQRILFTFKSAAPGIVSETWCLNTHPVLLGGASLQVTLRGVALYRDNTADQRQALQRELQQREAESVCRSLILEILQGVRTPEYPCSPAELYITEEEHFQTINPQLHYRPEAVEGLRHLWEQVSSVGEGDASEEPQTWDLCVSSLRQALLTLPEDDEEGVKEQALARLNALVLELHQPLHPPPKLPRHSIGLQLWRELLDGLVREAVWLRRAMGLPELETWGEARSEEALGKGKKEDKRGGPNSKEEEKKGTAKQAGKDKPTESQEQPSSKRKVRDEREKRAGRPGKPPSKAPPSSPPSPGSDSSESQPEQMDLELQEKYHRHLHDRVYVLMGSLVDSLCDLLEEVESDPPDPAQSKMFF
ncbi:MYCBP-associated protein [Megalops cyprinoides]|uniref:MYCBP-associated protein n=1 Tax=Megalops cyprinoides TaxID=118141 RepID=UPI0018648770|nr:MYCBP-associated protein [Megalops cyprinoides]